MMKLNRRRIALLALVIGISVIPSKSTADSISYSISSPSLLESTFRPGGNLDFTFSLTTNNSKTEPVYCYIDGFLNPFEATLISGQNNNGRFRCQAVIPARPMELRSSGTYPLDVLVVYFDEFGKQDLRQTFGYIKFAILTPTPTPTPTPTDTPWQFFCQKDGQTLINNKDGRKFICVSTGKQLLPLSEAEALVFLEDKKLQTERTEIRTYSYTQREMLKSKGGVTSDKSLLNLIKSEDLKWLELLKIIDTNPFNLENLLLARSELEVLKNSTNKVLAQVMTQKRTILCIKGSQTKKITKVNPKCPKGYKKT